MLKLIEQNNKRETVQYKGFTIEHFPLKWTYGDKHFDTDGWIIQAPGYFIGNKDNKFPLPLRCHTTTGKIENFESLEDAKQWIDTYKDSYKIKLIKDEIHAMVPTDDKLNEAIEIHDELNPKLWDAEQNLLPEVKAKIIEIANAFIKTLSEIAVDFKADDIYLVGSNANYNYNDSSDIDIHIIADESFDCSKKHLPVIYQAYKTIFNSKYNITIKGIDVEIYVENKDAITNVSNSVYSIKKGWIKKPIKEAIPDIDTIALDEKVNEWENRYFDITTHPTVDKIDKYINDLYEMRQQSITTDGEYGLGNLTFKEIRKLGYLEQLKELRYKTISRNLSLESFNG